MMRCPVTKRQGHSIGWCMLVGGAAAAAHGLVMSQHHGAVYLIAAGACVLGTYLVQRLYLDDPAARREYVETIRSQPFSKSLKSMGIRVVVELVGGDVAQSVYLMEFPPTSTRFATIVSKISRSDLVKCVDADIVSKELLRRAFEKDIVDAERACLPFTSLWQSVKRDGMETAAEALQVLPTAEVTSLLFKEHGACQPSHYRGSPTASAPRDEDGSDAQGNTFQHIVAYGTFCVRYLGVENDFFCNVVRKCKVGRSRYYSKLLELGLQDVFKLGFVEDAWCAEKLQEELRETQVTLWELNAKVPLSVQIDCGMIRDARLFCGVFTAAIPTSPFAKAADHRCNVVAFLEHFEHLLSHHAEQLVRRDMWSHVLWVRAEWEAAMAASKAKFDGPEHRVDPLPHDATAAQRRALELKCDEVKKARDAFLKAEKSRIHAEFCQRVANHASDGGITVGSVCKLM